MFLMNPEKEICRKEGESTNWFLSAIENPSHFQRPWKMKLHGKTETKSKELQGT